MKHFTKKVDMIIDLQYGSTGKGLIAGFLAETHGYDTVVTANMPNAGHTYIDGHDRKWIHKCLPNGIVSPNLKNVLIGPGAVFDYVRLCTEIEDSWDLLRDKNIMIHPNAIVLNLSHKIAEQNSLSGISSTMQGSGEALMSKMRRNMDDDHRACVRLLSTVLEPYLCTHDQYLEAIYGSNKLLAEGAQGFSLGVNERFWPFCTSRDCTPARFLADMGIPVQMLNKVIGTARTFPIRVGNTADGYSGDCYGDQKEIEWSQIGVEPELTTVTKRPRRIFTFSPKQIRDAISACLPDEVFLNFCNYVSAEEVTHIEDVISFAGSRVEYFGVGPTFNDVLSGQKYYQIYGE